MNSRCTLLVVFFFTAVNPAQALTADQHLDPDHSHHAEHETHMEEVVVQATRSGRRVQDEIIRVEVIAGEEVEEKLLMRPGNISMMLNETGGLRVQVTSPAIGSANVRIHGMRGRYTQLLADGLPLYGGQAASLGLLQVPPSDLGQVEIIKGAASALYGGQALGGVINLVSKRPGREASGEVIVNTTSRDAQDLSAYLEQPLGGAWRSSLLATANRQTSQDLDDDGWLDMAGYERATLRPRLFWDGDDGSRLYMTVGAMDERRRGGTSSTGRLPDGEAFPQNQDTQRLDAGMVWSTPVNDWSVAQVRASSARQQHKHRFGSQLENDTHETHLIELSLSGASAARSWVAGLAYQEDRYQSDELPQFDYSYRAPAIFMQVEQDLSTDISAAVSTRWDQHSEYGDQLSPRLSLLYRPGDWTVRGSWGRGFYAPTPFIEETEAAGLTRLEALEGIEAETAETLSLDISYALDAWETGVTLFASDIDDAIALDASADLPGVRLVNRTGTTETRGAEALLRWRQAPYAITASYLYLDTREPALGGQGNSAVSLTPRHAAGLVAMWEEHDRGRLGLELYYTGEQSLADNPYRARSKPYLHVGLLGEWVMGRYRLFLNLENLLDVRQTREDPLPLPQRSADGRWTVDAWSPLEGFIANAGFRVKF